MAKHELSPAEAKMAKREKTQHELDAEKTVPRAERVERLLAGYVHGLEHGSPRTTAELAELKELLTSK